MKDLTQSFLAMKTIQLIEKEDITNSIREVVSEVLADLVAVQGQSEVLDNKGLCAMLSISPRTAQNYRDKGVIPHFRVFNKVYYKTADVMAALEAAGKVHDLGAKAGRK